MATPPASSYSVKVRRTRVFEVQQAFSGLASSRKTPLMKMELSNRGHPRGVSQQFTQTKKHAYVLAGSTASLVVTDAVCGLGRVESLGVMTPEYSPGVIVFPPIESDV